MIIRPATVFDANEITELWKLLIKDISTINKYYPNPETYFLNITLAIKKIDTVVLVAEDKDKIVGYAYSYLIRQAYSNELVIYGDDIFVLPKYRNGDIADRLMHRAKDILKVKPIMEVHMLCDYKPELIRLWRKRGFEPIRVLLSREV